MNLIVAVDQNWAIGKNGDLLFHLKGDMKRFRQMTTGKTVLLGRKTARIGLGEHAAALGDHTNGSSSPLPKTFLRALAWAGVSSATAYWA